LRSFALTDFFRGSLSSLEAGEDLEIAHGRPFQIPISFSLDATQHLLGNDLETNNETTSAAREQILNTQPLLSNAFANKQIPTATSPAQQ
jgi:hypothetical protein